MQKGEILVTSQTDIAWTPLFPRAGAIVTDVGAPLSHAAIVARELGIPGVVGCGNATRRLKTGECVLVDGGQGTFKDDEYIKEALKSGAEGPPRYPADMAKPKTPPVRESGVIFLIRVLTEGFSPAIANPNKKRRPISCHEFLTKA
ncbi:PEP-utilizing enzyme, mobile domain protein [Desulfosporosinus sp. OT]|nr:PEP-utilizing enzyme, mobile domain protein [Desulfosporosinus sp. OT]